MRISDGRFRGAPATRLRLTVLALVAAGLVSGCATEGTATGIAAVPGEGTGPATFYWSSSGADQTSGEIHVQLPDGKRYAGTYFQITQDVTSSSLGPLWVGWEPYWTGWGAPWAPSTANYGSSTFTTIYSGRVVATLRGPNDDGMRCRFMLQEPRRGLAGGGVGECQTRSGASIEDAVLTR
jgi:hypothetical protein